MQPPKVVVIDLKVDVILMLVLVLWGKPTVPETFGYDTLELIDFFQSMGLNVFVCQTYYYYRGLKSLVEQYCAITATTDERAK